MRNSPCKRSLSHFKLNEQYIDTPGLVNGMTRNEIHLNPGSEYNILATSLQTNFSVPFDQLKRAHTTMCRQSVGLSKFILTLRIDLRRARFHDLDYIDPMVDSFLDAA